MNGGMKRPWLLAALFALAAVLSGCTVKQAAPAMCTVVLEDHGEIRFRNQVFAVPRGSDLTVTAIIPQGKRIASVSYPGSVISPCVLETAAARDYQITLPSVRYPALVRLTLMPDYVTEYRFEDRPPVSVTDTSQRLRVNTLPWQQDFSRE